MEGAVLSGGLSLEEATIKLSYKGKIEIHLLQLSLTGI
jgi:hypothetical protein